jgi:hypothetical protein
VKEERSRKGRRRAGRRVQRNIVRKRRGKIIRGFEE